MPFPQFCGPLQGLDENEGTSLYNSFQLKLEKRYSKGVYMVVSYTNSKLMSNASDNTQQNAELGTQQGVLSPFAQRLARTISSDTFRRLCRRLLFRICPLAGGGVSKTGAALSIQ